MGLQGLLQGELHIYPTIGRYNDKDLVIQVGVRRKTDDLALQKNYCCEMQRTENGRCNSRECTNPVESSKEGYGSKRDHFATNDDTPSSGPFRI
jgi:hypothetical protein